jgi:diguanylate cyclase (GGDEF)-like protein/PAS domain S-box-containing protein
VKVARPQIGRVEGDPRSLRINPIDSGGPLYRKIFDVSTHGVVVIDRDSRIVAVNPAILKMLGYQDDDVMLANVARLSTDIWVTPESRDLFVGNLRRDGVVQGFETTFRRRDGTEFHVSLSGRTIEDPTQPDLQHVAFIDDVEDKDALRRALVEREATLEHAQSIAKLGHIIYESDGTFASWSNSMPGMVGLDTTCMPRSIREWKERLVATDDQPAFEKFIGACLRNDTPMGIEYHLTHTLGHSVHIRQTVESIDSTGTSAGRWFATLQDVSERRANEERIRRLNRTHSMISAVSSAIVRFSELSELFSEACRIAVSEGKFAAAWIGLIDPQSGVGRMSTSFGLDPQCLSQIEFSIDCDNSSAERVASRALVTGQAQIYNCIQADLARHPMLPAMTSQGHQSLAAFPLLVGEQRRAVLVLHAAEVGAFDDEEVRLLGLLARDLSFAMDYIDKSHQLDYLARFDSVTGLPNGTTFQNRIDQMLQTRSPSQLMVALLDLEHFSSINDSFGRSAGDGLLRDVSARLACALGRSAEIARFSADTFAIATTVQRSQSPEALADEIRQALAEPFVIDAHTVYVSVQIGLAGSDADHGDAASLIQRADLALKTARAEHETTVIFRPDIPTRTAQRAAFEAELRSAVKNQEFRLFYQPLVELEHGKMVSMEALIRWQHPQRGLQSPALFMQSVEDSDLAIPVGDWVLHTACRQTKAWLDAGYGPLSVSVNISARQFLDQDLVARVGSALEESGLPPGSLTLELTEGIVMRGAENFIAKLDRLKALGIRLSLDDFGTGYSSLSYLKRFPIDQLKIDQSFVRELVTNADDASIVRAILSVAHSLGLEVIAEGVELEAQLQWLRRHRCDKMQGYYFSRPIDAAAFGELLAAGRDLSAVLGEKNDAERTLLVVDDEKNILSAMVRLLRGEGYRILTATSAAEAYQVLAMNTVHVVMSDHRMPAMTGAEFLNSLRTFYPDVVRILFSGQVELEALTEAINSGEVYRFLLKPWDDDVLKKSIRDAFRNHWLSQHPDGQGQSERALPPAISPSLAMAAHH